MTTTGEDARVATRPALWRAVLVGVVAGLASGLFGVGGGIVIVPGLVMLAGLSQRLAHGTSLTAIIPIAIAGVVGYAGGDQVDVTVAAATALGALAGTPVGVALLGRLPDRTLRIGFAGVMALAALRLVVATGEVATRVEVTAVTVVLFMLTGLVAGVLSGLMGVGGGIVMVPAFTVLFGLPITLAKGTSLAVIVPGALVGTVRNRAQGTTDVRLGIVVGLSGVVSAGVASTISLGLDPTVSRRLFAALLLVAVVRLLRKLQRPSQDTA